MRNKDVENVSAGIFYIPKDFEPGAVTLLLKMLQVDPVKRATIKEIMLIAKLLLFQIYVLSLFLTIETTNGSKKTSLPTCFHLTTMNWVRLLLTLILSTKFARYYTSRFLL